MALGAVGIAALAGAGGGLVYAFVGRPARRLPVVGPYLAGTIAVAGYLACVLLVMALVGADDSAVDDLWAFTVVSVLFGLFVGHKWFRPAQAEI